MNHFQSDSSYVSNIHAQIKILDVNLTDLIMRFIRFKYSICYFIPLKDL